MAEQKIRWGVLGPGKISIRFGEGLSHVEDAVLQAVGSRSLTRGNQFAKKFQVANVYSSYQDLVDDPEVVVIYIATPHRFHFEQAKMCLEAGKHVLVEKPFTVNAAEAEQLFMLAKQNDLFVMEAMWTYFLPMYQQVRQWLDTGKIGEVKFINSSFGFRAPRDPEGRLFNPELAGGALLDIGIYNLAVSQWVTQQEIRSFEVSGLVGETGVDDLVAGILNFEGGAIAQFNCSFLSIMPNELSIYGTLGEIHIRPNFWQATKATLVRADKEKTVRKPFKASGFEYEIDEVCRCIRAGLLESPVHPHRQILTTMRLMDAIRERLGVVYPFE
ncbi:MAG: Gfo/Idh/MocA family oxidoreductase [Chloroflexota bacterium]